MAKIKSKFKSIIFDFDGVISNTDKGRFEVLHHILQSYNINLKSFHKIEELSGITTDYFLSKNYENLTSGEIKEIINKRRELYLNNLDKYCIPIDGALDVIYKYSKLISLYIATTNECNVAEKLAEHLKISGYFNYIFCREDVEIKDSNLKNYGSILKIINNKPQECIIIEDSEVGVISAKNNGIFCVKFGNQKFSSPIKPDYEANNYSELDKILSKLLS